MSHGGIRMKLMSVLATEVNLPGPVFTPNHSLLGDSQAAAIRRGTSYRDSSLHGRLVQFPNGPSAMCQDASADVRTVSPEY